MAPFPEEVDLFALPHACMRRLIGAYSVKHSRTNYHDEEEVKLLLSDLQLVVSQVKSHEEIENKYIMERLSCMPELISVKPSSGHAVLDRHLATMLSLVRNGCPCCPDKSPKKVCTRYGHHLRLALENFTTSFFHHMQEEEEVFQPMLMQHLDYEELKMLREVILNHHQWIAEGLLASTILPPLEVSVQRMKELDSRDCQTEKWEAEELDWWREDRIAGRTEPEAPVPMSDVGSFGCLPSELKLAVFSFLPPTDLETCTRVCGEWRDIAFHASFWHNLYPVHWARGLWSAHRIKEDELPMEAPLHREQHAVEETRVVSWLLDSVVPHVGGHVQKLVLSGSSALTSEQLHTFLASCVHLRHLDISYTTVSSMAFAGLKPPSCSRLRHLDVSGNDVLTDGVLFRLSRLWEGRSVCAPSQTADDVGKFGLQFLSLSGCRRITKYGLARLAMSGMLFPLTHLDLSGCANLLGRDVAWMTAHCPRLQPDGLSYCDNTEDGPHPQTANGCQNVGSRRRFCCRKD